jgi:chemotaxis response regulator CheB
MSYSTLIVDDEPNARAYIENLVSENNALQLCGTCVSGNEALRFCETIAPEIIFLDIQMPNINGIETARALLRKKATTPIIIF